MYQMKKQMRAFVIMHACICACARGLILFAVVSEFEQIQQLSFCAILEVSKYITFALPRFIFILVQFVYPFMNSATYL